MTTAAADFPVRADLDHDSHGAAPLHAGVVAVDCEMCQTEEGDTVTRLTLVDHVGRVIVDTLVKPAARIIDYRTQYSGITESLLQDVNVTTEQALATFLRVVSADTVLVGKFETTDESVWLEIAVHLVMAFYMYINEDIPTYFPLPLNLYFVGHSLDSDLHALRVCHLRCVDTAILYPHPRGYPYRRKLKVLAEAFLQMVIQRGSGAGSGAGHDSVEDARAAMQLAKLKAEQGWGFGLPRRARDENGEYDTGRMPLLSHCFDSTQPLRTAAITSIPVAKASSEAGAGVDVVCDLGTCLGGGVPVLNVPDAGDGTEADTSAAVSYLCDQLFLDSRISGPVDGDAIGGEVDAAVNLGRRFGCLVLDAAEAGCTQTRDAVQVVQARCRQFMTLPAAQSEGSTNGGDTAETSSMLTSAPSQSAGLCVLLSAQCPEGPARALSRQKRACANPQAAATWSALQEDRLRFEVNKANMAAAAVVLS
jgi:DNA polymerase III epsilon subunit-like protein